MSGKVNVAVIGTGHRAIVVIKQLLRFSKGAARIAAIYEPDQENAQRALSEWNSPDSRVCGTPDEAIKAPDADVVMIFTPNYLHRQYIEMSLAAGKNVFSEKPLATTIEDCQAICRLVREAHDKNGQWLMTGFVLRYSMVYRKIKELLDSGRFGRVLSISASENRPPDGGGSSMSNWRRFTKQSGPYILEKCCHDLDLLNWFTQSIPTRVAGFGGLDFFIPENDHLWRKYGEETFSSHVPESRRQSPFLSEKDVKDNHVSIIQYRNGVKAMFHLTLSNAIPARRMYIACSEGTISLDGDLKFRTLGDPCVTTLSYLASDHHAGGDPIMMREFWDMLS